MKKKIWFIPKRGFAKKEDYLQKSGLATTTQELLANGIENTYYLVISRECGWKGFTEYKEVS